MFRKNAAMKYIYIDENIYWSQQPVIRKSKVMIGEDCLHNFILLGIESGAGGGGGGGGGVQT